MKLRSFVPRRFMLVVLGVTLLLLGVSFNLWAERLVRVSFVSEAQKDIEYQVFWTHKDTARFNQAQSVKQKVAKGRHKVEIFLPTKKLAQFRLDFGVRPGKVEVSSLRLAGNKALKLAFQDFNYNKFVKDKKIDGYRLTLISDGNDPFIVYKNKLKLRGGVYVDWFAFIILATVYFLVSYKTVKYLARFKIEQHHSRIDIVFLVVFFGLLFVPMAHISDAEKSAQENRMLAKKPSFATLYAKGGNFGKLYEQWFNDRFFGRKQLLELHDIISSFVLRNGNRRVLIGDDGWLFYKGDNSLRNYQNLDLFTDSSLENAARYLSDIDIWAKQNGKKFYFIICPDKNKIYGEHISYINKVRDDSQSRANQLINYLHKHTSVKVIYPYEELHEAKRDRLVYWKNDTHWNYWGAYVGYKTLIKIISEDLSIPLLAYDSLKNEKHRRGDLNNMISSVKPDEVTEYYRPLYKDSSQCKGNLANEAECKNPNYKYKAVIFRDSFTTAMAPYLNNTFGQVNYVKHYNIMERDIKGIQDADIVILEVVERFIFRLSGFQFPKE